MNIYAYDPMDVYVDHCKTWIDYEKGMLYSREFKLKTYFFTATKYNEYDNTTNFFIIFTNIKPEDNRVYGYVTRDKVGRFRVNIQNIIRQLKYKPDYKVENIDISIDDEDENSIAYRIDI